MKFIGAIVVLVLLAWIGAKKLGLVDPKLEVTEFQCERTSLTDVVVSGTVKNASKESLELTANVALLFVVDRSPHKVGGPVQPKPLPPGESGRFEIRSQLPSSVPPMGKMDSGRSLAAGDCRLDSFTDAAGASLTYVDSSPSAKPR